MMANTTGQNYPNLLFNEVETGTISLSAITGFVILGLIMTITSIITLWLVTGYFVRFNDKFKNQYVLKLSVIIALIWSYINGFSRIFLNTNLIVNNTTILSFRCDDIILFNFANEQFNQLGVYIFFLTRLRQFNIFTNGHYYALLFMISFATLFTMVMTPFYAIPRISIADNHEDLVVQEDNVILCNPGSVQDANIFGAWIGYLSVDTVAQFMLFMYLWRKGRQVWNESTMIIKRVLVSGVLCCLLNIIELPIFIITGGQTIRGVRIVIYCIIPILSSLEITAKTKSGDSNWFLWCNYVEKEECDDEENIAKNIVGSVNLAEMDTKSSNN